jgi:hypothetical protein
MRREENVACSFEAVVRGSKFKLRMREVEYSGI